MHAAFSISKVGDFHTVFWLHTSQEPPAQLWRDALAFVRTYVATKKLTHANLRSVVVSDGGAPNTRQRAELAREPWSDHKVAVVTNMLSNPIKRGIATALGWVHPNMRFFQPTEVSRALVHVDLAGHAERIMSELDTLQSRLPPTRTLDEARGRLRAA